MRIEVDAAHVAGVEFGLRAVEVAERRRQSPVQRRGAEWPVEDVVAEAGQVNNSRLVAVGGAGKGLEAFQRNGGDEPIVGVGDGDVNLTFLKSYTRFESAAKVALEDVPADS